MRHKIILLLSLVFINNLFFAQTDWTKYVNPFIGTGGHGHTYPGSSTPFGMMQLSPDTRLIGWDACSGYHYSDSTLYGFSHTHLSGTGIPDYNDLLILPYNPDAIFKDDKGEYLDYFSHNQEKASPGYYAVHLEKGNIDAEVTSTERAGMHHYTFNDSKANVVIDVNHRDELIDYELVAISGTQIIGKRISKGWAQKQFFYFSIEFSKPFKIVSTELNGKRLYLSFEKTNDLYIKVGMSNVDLAGAKQNLQKEIPDWNFNAIKQATKDKWNKELNKIQVFSSDTSFLTTYYTALYHSFLNPNLFTDVDGRYRGTDLEIHKTDDNQYTVFSLWDTFRATHPLFTLVQQKRTAAFIRTFLRQYKDGGRLPVWELAGNYTGCMIGYHVVSVIADAFAKGIRDFDTTLALEAMVSISKRDELGKKAFHNLGYIPLETEHESVSKTLAYAYNDWCISTMAKQIGNIAIATEYNKYAQFYKNQFNPENGFMQAKIHNSFQVPFDPKEVNFNFTEANSWQYSFFVPQDIQGWTTLLGGKSKLEEKLNELFSTTSSTTGREQVDITGLIGQYAHGNEPSHQISFLYNYAGKPWLTQEKTEQIINTMYAPAPDGLSGNEDCGQMSSWLNLTALGIYAVTPGSPEYNLTVPHLDSAKIQLENGAVFAIETKNRNPKIQNYIQKVLLNGKEWDKSYIPHNAINTGGKLTFILGDKPSDWATKDGSSAHSYIETDEIAILPYFSTPSTSFFDSINVSINTTDKNETVYYTIDGSTPTTKSKKYTQAIQLRKTTTIKAIAVVNDIKSQVIEATYHLLTEKWDISIQSPYNPQYSAGGDKALIDFQRGGNDFRTGAWQGYQGESFKAVVDLKKETTLHKVGGDFIQDVRSWIWMPKQLVIWVSKDSVKWEKVATIINTVASDNYDIIVKELTQEIKPTKARYVKFEAEQFGAIPEWHLGVGGESFIFIDELILE